MTRNLAVWLDLLAVVALLALGFLADDERAWVSVLVSMLVVLY